ncbi:hypothetical protein OHA10_05060 [Kribbella sp. NBC_00662]|uniref:hypothetical protein n=1 Tax=Kribbella sp. NBC_00662 TaxID=2975969 RepID=UPI00325087F1
MNGLRLAGPLADPQHHRDADGGREYFASADETGRRIMVRIDAVALGRGRQVRVHVNTSTDNHVVHLSDQLADDEIGPLLSASAAELVAVRRRAELDLPPVRTQLLDPARTEDRGDPRAAVFADNDLIRIAALDWQARQGADMSLEPVRRAAARAAFSAGVDDCGLRVRTGGSAEEDASAYRRLAVEPLLSTPGARWLAELGRPIEELPAADQNSLRLHRAAVASHARNVVAPRPQVTERDDLQQLVRAAQSERERLSALTMQSLRAGTSPRVRLMIGGGAALTARPEATVLVDDRQRWHVDPLRALVQSTDQMRHLHESGLGDPYEFARPRERFPLAALHYMEDSAAVRGPVVNGRVQLSVGPSGRLMGEIRPSDGTAAVRVEVDGAPLIATGLPAERVPGVSRTVPTVPAALDVISGHLGTIGSSRAIQLRDGLAQLYPVAEDPGTAELVVDTLRREGRLDAQPELAEAVRTLIATADWDRARRQAPGRAVFGDEVSNGSCYPQAAQRWLIAGRGGSGFASAAIILEGNPDANVVMVGGATPMVLQNTALYAPFLEEHDRAVNPSASGRLVTVPGARLGGIATATGADGRTAFRMLDARGQELRGSDGRTLEGDGYVACTGRPRRMPRALEPLARWAEATKGAMLMNADRQYLGYQLTFANGEVRHRAQVIGAASRVLPEVFTPAHVRQLVEIDLQEAPPESGNVAVGFMSTAIQGSQIADHRDRVAKIVQAEPADAPRHSTARSRNSSSLTR